MRNRMNAAIIMGLIGAMGVAADANARLPREKPRRDPVRDAEKIAEAKGKRAKKAAKRALIAARNVKPEVPRG